MNGDIIEQLRSPYVSTKRDELALRSAAADEIERLRIELRTLADAITAGAAASRHEIEALRRRSEPQGWAVPRSVNVAGGPGG